MSEPIQILSATVDDIPHIQSIAFPTWQDTFIEILSAQQIAYMLNMMYSTESLTEQMNKGIQFVLAKYGNEFLGFAGFETNYTTSAKTKLHKLYILPSAQGRGVGKLLMNAVAKSAAEMQNKFITLNVNRQNKAVAFYERNGFKITAEEDIDIGNGYWMNDYIMQKQL